MEIETLSFAYGVVMGSVGYKLVSYAKKKIFRLAIVKLNASLNSLQQTLLDEKEKLEEGQSPPPSS